MNTILNYIKKNKTTLLIVFLLLLVFTGIFSLNRAAPDTYSLESYQYMFQDKLPYFKDGRFFMTAFVLILKFLHVPYSIFKLCAWGLAFLSLFIGVVIFNEMLKKATKKSNILLSFLTIVNIFVLEFFIFADYSGVMCLGILNAVISANFFLNFLIKKEKKSILLAMLFSLFTAFCYQGVISLVIILPIIFTLKYSKKFLDFVKNNLWLILVYAIPTFSALIIGKLLGTNRLVSSSASLMERIEKILSQTGELLTGTAQILPKYLFLTLLILGIVIFIIALWKEKEKWMKYIFLLYCIIACFIVPLAPQFVIDYNNIWLVPRSSVGLGILCLIPFLIYSIYGKPNKKVIIIFTSCILILSVFQFRGYLSMGYSQIRNNVQEEIEASKILNEIYNYEQENAQIKNIVIYPDKNVTYVYQNIRFYKDINTRVGSRDWGVQAILYRSLNRSLKKTQDNDFEKYCATNNWNEYSKETIKIENETLYICMY